MLWHFLQFLMPAGEHFSSVPGSYPWFAAWSVAVHVLLICYEYAVSSQPVVVHISAGSWCLLSKLSDVNCTSSVLLSVRALPCLVDWRGWAAVRGKVVSEIDFPLERSRCASLQEASVLLEEMRLFDSRVYGVAHGLLMGLRQHVWGEAEGLFDEIARMDYTTGAAFYNALTDVLWHFGQVWTIPYVSSLVHEWLMCSLYPAKTGFQNNIIAPFVLAQDSCYNGGVFCVL